MICNNASDLGLLTKEIIQLQRMVEVEKFSATLDYVWIGGARLGILLDFSNWKLYATALGIWGIVAPGVYLPLLIKKLKK